MKKLVADIEAKQIKDGLPEFRVGDTIKVFMKIVEGGKERIQPYEGVVVMRKGGGAGETFTVRKVSFGIGVERKFPLNSPRIEKIELIKSGKVRRAKLYYLRELKGKAAKIKEKTRQRSA